MNILLGFIITWFVSGILAAGIFWYDLQYNLFEYPGQYDREFEESYRKMNRWLHIKASLWVIKWGFIGLFVSICGYHKND